MFRSAKNLRFSLVRLVPFVVIVRSWELVRLSGLFPQLFSQNNFPVPRIRKPPRCSSICKKIPWSWRMYSSKPIQKTIMFSIFSYNSLFRSGPALARLRKKYCGPSAREDWCSRRTAGRNSSTALFGTTSPPRTRGGCTSATPERACRIWSTSAGRPTGGRGRNARANGDQAMAALPPRSASPTRRVGDAERGGSAC